MRWVGFLCVSIIVILFASVPFAEMYSWTDANGVKHFSQEPPPEGVEAASSWREVVSAPADVEDVNELDAAADERETKITRLGKGVVVPVTFGYKGRQINMNLLVDTAPNTPRYTNRPQRHTISRIISP